MAGAGAVVTKDVPDDAAVVRYSVRVVRTLTPGGIRDAG